MEIPIMAYFAELDQNNIVLQVVAISDADLLDENNNESETKGIARCKELFGSDTIWMQTSFNTTGNVHANGKTPLRKNFAGIGYTYNQSLDGFIAPKPQDNLVLNETTGLWVDPNPITPIGVTRV
jgi:hypothetical protein